jgi:uncharacterized protein (TIGR01777 family)
MLQKIIIAGGSGFIGQSLQDCLERAGYEVVILSRRPEQNDPRQRYWDAWNVGDWAETLEGAAAVVNLTGRSVNCVHTPENRHQILSSRVQSVQAIAQALAEARRPPPVWVQAGSLAIVGDTGDRWCDEDTPPADDFSAQVCQAWEKACLAPDLPGVRRVLLRIGFVLGRDGGALKVLARLTRLFLGGAAGSGRQYISWLHEDDLNRLILAAIRQPDFQGVYHAAGPAPATNAEFMRELRRVLQRPWSPPVPVWAVKIGATLMGTEAHLALTGRRCTSRRLAETGFAYQHTGLRETLVDLLKHNKLTVLPQSLR